MTSKSRLGKGLGALFPALPGESRTAHAEQRNWVLISNPRRRQPTRKPLKRKLRLRQRRSNPIRAVLNNTVRSTAPVRLGEIKRKTIPAMKDSIPAVHKSTTVEKPKSGKRVAMPGISDMAHPSDCFSEQEHGTSDSRKRSRLSVPRAQRHPARKSNKETPELKPVEGGYLLDIPVSSIVPNARSRAASLMRKS